MQELKDVIDPRLWISLALLVAAGVLAYAGMTVALRIVRRVARRSATSLDEWLVEHLRRPLKLVAVALGVRLATPALQASLPVEVTDVVQHAVSIVLIVSVGWSLATVTGILDEILRSRFDLSARDNLSARRVVTRFRLLRRSLVLTVWFLTLAAVLVTFPGARQIGTGLFASAGIAGIVIGMAARPTVEAMLAGVQLALTEPINLDDVLIVEGEWGRVEEITATYVVLHIWDKRRLIIPVSYFLTKPFQNWTRVTADLLAAVTVDVDYATPVEEVRKAAGEIVEASADWDRDFWNLQVTDAGERTMRLRVLATAADSSKAWNLRCEVREKLITWLQAQHPESLPRVRAEVAGPQSG